MKNLFSLLCLSLLLLIGCTTQPKNELTEEKIIEILKTINGVKSVEAATEETDQNKLLNKPGNYISVVYFDLSSVNIPGIEGSPVAKGTIGGGAIETFKTEADAKKRNEYLAKFDNAGLLSSGSHKVLGKMVIRTSKELTASQQKELEDKIIEKLSNK